MRKFIRGAALAAALLGLPTGTWAAPQTTTFYAQAGQQSYPHAAGLTITGVTVNGSAATFTDTGTAVSITSPTLANGDKVVETGTLAPVANASAAGPARVSPTVVAGSSSAATPNAAAINAAIQTLGTAGGGIVQLPCGQIYTGATIDNNVSNVLVVGCGSSGATTPHYGSGTAVTTSTEITPTFAGVVLRHRTPYNASSKKNLGGGFVYLTVDENSLATTLMDIDSVGGGRYDLVLNAKNATQAVLSETCVSNTNIADACDVQAANMDLLINIGTGGTADGFVATGSSNANTSFNNIVLRVRNNGTGSPGKFISADNNIIAYNQVSNTTGLPLTMYGPTAAHPVGGDQNIFTYVTGATYAIVAQGTDTGGVTGGVHNRVMNLDTANGTPAPTAGTGSSWAYSNDTGPLYTTNDQFLGGRSVTAPGLSFLGDSTSGFYDSVAGQINVLLSGVYSGGWSNGAFSKVGTTRPYVDQAQTTATCSTGANAVTYRFLSPNAAASSKIFGAINVLTSTCTSTAENGEMDLLVMSAGTLTTAMSFTATKATAATALALKAVTVAGLPTCNATYQDGLMVVTDATAPTYRGALTGGGAVRTPVYCDGTSWTAH